MVVFVTNPALEENRYLTPSSNPVVFAVQMGAGGLGVSLPCRSRGGRLLVSRQPDQGRRPGFQQRGQLHVTAAR